MADNKININVEVVNNTKQSISTIMSDMANMNASIQASMVTTNQLITQSMQKSAATIQAANQTASASASGSFQTMQLNATKSADATTESFRKSATELASMYKTASTQVSKTTEELVDKMKSTLNIKDGTFERVKAGFDLINQSIIDTNASMKEYFRAIQATKDRLSELTGEEAKLAEGLNKTVDAILANKKSVADSIRGAREEYKKLGSTVENTNKNIAESTDKSTKSSNNALSQLAKRFISIAAAIYLVRKAYMEATASVKAYEEAAISQGKLSKGNAAGPMLEQSFKQLQIEAGSVLEPYMKTFAEYMKTNSAEIEASVRKATDVMVNVVKLAVGMIEQVANVIYVIMDGVMIGITGLINGVMNLIDNTIMKLPGVSKDAKEGFKAAVKETDLWVRTWINLAETHAQDLAKSSDKVSEAMAGLLAAFAGDPKSSGVKAQTADQKAALQKLRDLYKSEMEWMLALKKKASETSINEDYAAQEKINNEYLANKERIYNDEKKFNIDLTAFKIANEYIYATETKKLQDERYERDMKIINDSHKARIDEINAARAAASSAGLLNTKIQSIPPSTGSLGLSGNKAASKASYTGNEELRKKLEADLKLYDELDKTIGNNDAQLAEMRINIATETSNYLMQIEYDTTQAKVDSISQTVNAYADAGNMIAEIANNVYQVQLNNINRETEERQKALDKAYANASKYVKNKGKLDKQQKDANEKLQEEQAAKTKEIQEKQKNAAVAQALIAGAVATMNAWSSSMQMGMPAGLIMGIVMSGIITALTVAQVAVIESQKFAQGGIVQGPTSGDRVTVQANGGEMILNSSQQASLWNMIASKSGSTNSSTASINMAGDTYIVSGSLDKTAVSEIRRMKEERQAQLKADIKELSYRNQLQLA